MVRYMVEHAKSARAKCNKCKATIAKDECRVGKLSESTTEHGQCKWYHVHCFAPPRTLKAATSLEGFDALDADEQHAVEQQFDVAKKPTSQQLSEARNLTPRELHVCQFVEKLALPTLTEILRLNHLRIDGTKPYLIERVFDGMIHGGIPPCPLCNTGKLALSPAGWTCSGTFDVDRRVTTRCKFTAPPEAIERTFWRMPAELATECNAL